MKSIRFAVTNCFIDADGVDNQFVNYHLSILLAIRDFFSLIPICYRLKFRVVRTANL